MKSVLLLIADDWSPIAGAYGNTVVRTPNVDALAARATTFDYAFCTTPSCAASRANILTGHYSHTHGQYGHTHAFHNFRTLAHMPSIPKTLGAHGYLCGAVGKQHVEPREVYPWHFEAGGNGRNVQAIAGHVARFLKEAEGRPFYLHVGFSDPHRDFGNNRTYPGVKEVRYDPREVEVPPFLPDHPDVRAELAEYYQAISRLDQGIGMVLAALEASGRAGETLVICMSDHGMPFPGAKASSFDSGHHCPLIIARPGVRRAVRSKALVNWCNIAPTVYEWCGVPPVEGLPERSLLPILDEENPAGWDETYFSHTFHEVTNYYPYRVLRGRRYKYVRNLFPELQVPLPSDLWSAPTWQAVQRERMEMMGQRPTARFLHRDAEELFDLEADPVESRNLINDPDLREVAETMRQKVRAFRKATNDPWIRASIQAGEEGF